MSQAQQHQFCRVFYGTIKKRHTSEDQRSTYDPEPPSPTIGAQTEQIFQVNGLGQLLVIAIEGADIPLVQTLTFIFAVLIVAFNLVADVVYGILDPRIRYD